MYSVLQHATEWSWRVEAHPTGGTPSQMVSIVDYSVVLETLLPRRFKSLYHNSGAFGFEAQVTYWGWIGAIDHSIRPEVLAYTIKVSEPVLENLVKMFVLAWQRLLPGKVWVMPKSHWHYEMHFGNKEWLENSLSDIGIDPEQLRDRNNGSAIEFGIADAGFLEHFLRDLLSKLAGSDFMAVFPEAGTVCTIHHHQQLWWQSNRPELIDEIRQLMPE